MADAVTIDANGKAGMAYVGNVPWHGLGNKLTAGASFEEWTVESGLDFHVERAPIQYAHGDKLFQHPSREVLFRDDTNAPLGIVSNGYKVVQPKEVMHFFQDLAEIGHFEMETAGSLHGGAKVWALAKINDGAPIIDGDVVKPYVLMATSFDGSTATVAKLTAIRVVCNNTLTMAIGAKGQAAGEAGNIVRVAHHSQWDGKKARLELGIYADQWEKFLLLSRRMAETKLPGFVADQFLCELLAKKDSNEEDIRASRQYQTIMGLFDGGAIGSDLTQGRTVWQFVNSVTQYVDHSAGQLTDNRMRSAWFGAGNTMKMKAYAKAAELVAG